MTTKDQYYQNAIPSEYVPKNTLHIFGNEGEVMYGLYSGTKTTATLNIDIKYRNLLLFDDIRDWTTAYRNHNGDPPCIAIIYNNRDIRTFPTSILQFLPTYETPFVFDNKPATAQFTQPELSAIYENIKAQPKHKNPCLNFAITLFIKLIEPDSIITTPITNTWTGRSQSISYIAELTQYMQNNRLNPLATSISHNVDTNKIVTALNHNYILLVALHSKMYIPYANGDFIQADCPHIIVLAKDNTNVIHWMDINAHLKLSIEQLYSYFSIMENIQIPPLENYGNLLGGYKL